MKKLFLALLIFVALEACIPPTAVSASSPEEQLVERTYTALLGRAPDPDGLQFWIGRLQVESPSRVIERIMGSAEFVNADPEFDEIYRAVFGREIDHEAAVFWPTKDYVEAVTFIVLSDEALERWGHSPIKPLYRPVWDALAECESGGDWSINTGNGYYGGLQFSLRSWNYVGGEGYPHHASKAEQIERGELLLQTPPYERHWPVCGPRVGLKRP